MPGRKGGKRGAGCGPVEGAKVWLEAQQLYSQLGDNDAARRCIANALECDPGNYDAHYQGAQCLLKQGMFDEAHSHVRWCLQRTPSNPALADMLREALKGRLDGQHRAAAKEDEPRDERPEPFVDIHCHLLPGLDDGAPAWDEALAMAEMAVADGIGTIVATPHQLGSHAKNSGEAIRAAAARFQQFLDRGGCPCGCFRGPTCGSSRTCREKFAAARFSPWPTAAATCCSNCPTTSMFPWSGCWPSWPRPDWSEFFLTRNAISASSTSRASCVRWSNEAACCR